MVTLRGASLLVVGVMVGYQLGAQQQHQISSGLPLFPQTAPLMKNEQGLPLGMTANNDDASSSFDLARHESRGFFTDIPQYEWNLLRNKTRSIQPNMRGSSRRGRRGMGKWLQNHYEPDFACRHERRVGNLGDGGKWICDPHRISKEKTEEASCVVYSIGCNGDTSFERAVLETEGMEHCEIHTFDIDDYSEKVKESTGNRVHFHYWGLGNKNEQAVVEKGGIKTVCEFKTLAETIKLLGHENRTIDIFKIDCEGCEWTTFSSWFEANVQLRQVLIELHSTLNTHEIPIPAAPDFFDRMYQEGYVIFHKELNSYYWDFAIQAVEYAFLQLDQSFFLDDEGKSWLKDSRYLLPSRGPKQRLPGPNITYAASSSRTTSVVSVKHNS